ncbi:copper amine oxidase N-terminal domain-containing protein [Paenibacillus sp. TRM 82003]|nr:copper amine oxidase N-terminal domain-containing protein [Paenibacillus sp. TRM 82003]
MLNWKKSAVLAIVACSLLSGGSFAAASEEVALYIDGRRHVDFLNLDGRMMVQLVALQDPAWTFSYEAATNTVVVVDAAREKTIRMQAGADTIDVNGVATSIDAPVTIRDGRTYVPLRFIAEQLGGFASYDAEERRAVVRTSAGQTAFATLMSGDLTVAREIVARLELVYEDGLEPLPLSGEGFTTTYEFPRGEALRLTEWYKGMAWYAEVSEDGLKVVKWQKDSLIEGAEIGKAPEPFGETVFFQDNWMGETLAYGTIDASGTATELGKIVRWEDGPYKTAVIVPIEGETRTDAKE